jgi:2-polyprenyl-3-methyl-5-hydroxy-6-metoxy-1,4-benzoquinol methylase
VINHIFRKSMRARFAKTLTACQPVAGKTVLDVGCGPGHYAVALAQRGVSAVTGIDFAPAMVELARTRAAAAGVAERCTFIVGDFLTHEFAAPFDYVVLMGLMDYMADAPAAISRALALARGKALFSFPAAGGVLALQRRWRYRRKCPLFMYSLQQLRALFADIPGVRVTIDKLHRDYFVTVTRRD